MPEGNAESWVPGSMNWGSLCSCRRKICPLQVHIHSCLFCSGYFGFCLNRIRQILSLLPPTKTPWDLSADPRHQVVAFFIRSKRRLYFSPPQLDNLYFSFISGLAASLWPLCEAWVNPEDAGPQFLRRKLQVLSASLPLHMSEAVNVAAP